MTDALYPTLRCKRCARDTEHRFLGTERGTGTTAYECTVCHSMQSVRGVIVAPPRLPVAPIAAPSAAICLVYIAGPYTSPDPWQAEQNVRAAEALAYEVAKLGGMPVCPHSNTRPYFDGLQTPAFWYEGTLALLTRCDAAIFTHDWQRSSGARNEHAWCKANGLPRFDQPGVGALMALAHWLKRRQQPALAASVDSTDATAPPPGADASQVSAGAGLQPEASE